MASAIDATKPVTGTPTTQSVRDQFATAASEITALQARVPVTWTVGSVPFATSTTVLGEDNANLNWDNTNKRLGIGTTAPGGKIEAASATHVGDAGFASQLVATDTSANAAGNGGWINLRGVYTGTSTTDFAAIAARKVSAVAGEYHADLSFYARQNGSGTWTAGSPQMVIQGQTGNVGIGTSGPRQKVEVSGTGPVFTMNDASAAADARTYDFVPVGTSFYGRLASDNYVTTANWLKVDRATTTLNGVNFPGAGGVQIGAPTGGYKGIGNLNCTGAYVNNVVLTSDQDLKTDIEPLLAALPIVAAIEPKSFKWKPLPDVDDGFGNMIPAAAPDFAERLNRGFLAQDVFEVLGGDITGVDLGAMVAVLWQAVRELQDEVNELKGDKPAPRH